MAFRECPSAMRRFKCDGGHGLRTIEIDKKSQYVALHRQGLAWGGAPQKAIIIAIGVHVALDVSQGGSVT